MKSIVVFCAIIFAAYCTVFEPNGLEVPLNGNNGEIELNTFFASQGETINWITDAQTEPSTFLPQQQINLTFVLNQAGYHSGVAWYNADGTSNPPVYQIVVPGAPVGTVIHGADIASSPNYKGGRIGFALLSPSGTYYSQYGLNLLCSTCNPQGNWIMSLVYKSNKGPNDYYLCFEDGSVSYNGWNNDGDFNDDVFFITGLNPIVCGNGIIETGEQCDPPGGCCSLQCTFSPHTTVCHSSTGVCDPNEYCTGSSATCPSDSYAPSGTLCRSANGVCDNSEYCTGSSPSCPADNYKSGTLCHSATDVCDTNQYCSGSSPNCPADVFQPSSTVCRASAGTCDVAEYCTGSSASCPANGYQPSSDVCRPSAGPCDVAENCPGNGPNCPADSFQSSSVVCRPSAGVCDVAENCPGNGPSCPANSFQPSSVVCRPSAGICDIAENCPGNGVNCPADSVEPNTFVCRQSIGPCDPTEYCDGSDVTCPDDSNGSFESACSGLTLSINGNSYSWLNYDVIVFGDFNAATGDVEGRVAVQNDASVGAGWSVGYKTHSVPTDQTLPYAFVVGNDLFFSSGAVYPDGTNNPYPGQEENIFVGDSFTGPAYLDALVTGSCNGNLGCLNSQFNAVQQCYIGYSNNFASYSDNVQHLVQWSGLYVTCNDPNANTYYLTLQPSDFSQSTYTELSNCNADARWVINVAGTGDVTITGASFPAASGATVYNIIGSGRTVNVQTEVDGTILAPTSTVNQPLGVIVGKLIAADVTVALQVNKDQCFFPNGDDDSSSILPSK